MDWSYTIFSIMNNTEYYNFEIEDNTLRIYYEDDVKSILLEIVE